MFSGKQSSVGSASGTGFICSISCGIPRARGLSELALCMQTVERISISVNHQLPFIYSAAALHQFPGHRLVKQARVEKILDILNDCRVFTTATASFIAVIQEACERKRPITDGVLSLLVRRIKSKPLTHLKLCSPFF